MTKQCHNRDPAWPEHSPLLLNGHGHLFIVYDRSSPGYKTLPLQLMDAFKARLVQFGNLAYDEQKKETLVQTSFFDQATIHTRHQHTEK